MRKVSVLVAILLAIVAIGHPEPINSTSWNFRPEFLADLLQSVPKILKTQDKASGRFGSGVWIPGDQSVIYPLAAAWALKDPANRWYHDPGVMDAIMLGGDALIMAQDKEGQWMFRKKDNSTWGKHFDPWVYSRWVRAFSLISDAMPPERRARWEQGLELGYSGIEKHELSRVHNIPAHQALGLYVAGKALNHPDWCATASAFLVRVAQAQAQDGFWSEHVGPVVHYNSVYVDALGTYYGISHDSKVLPALERAARFHANFSYPDGSSIETIDERNPYLSSHRLPGVGFSFCPEGRGYLRQQWSRLQQKDTSETADILASLLLYGGEGPVAPPPATGGDSVFVTQDGKASVIRRGSWCASLSAYACPVYPSRWIQDRQNFVSLFHDKTGLILGGGNTKLQPLWSTFTVGETSLLHQRPGDEAPNFSQPAGLVHVPSKASLETNAQSLVLEYGLVRCSVAVDISQKDRARLTYAADCSATASPIEAHMTFLPALGKSWRTASGMTGRLGAKPFKLTANQAGKWFEHNGWRVELPENSVVVWPVLPHNPYRKDGHAEPEEGRIVVILPFSRNVTSQDVAVSI